MRTKLPFKLILIFLIGCSYTNQSDRPEFTERLFKVQISPSSPELANTCLADCQGDITTCPNGIGKAGIMPVISWTEPHPDVEQFAIIMESNETHRTVGSTGQAWGCWEGTSNDTAGGRVSNCVHMVIYQIPAIQTQVDPSFPKTGTPLLGTDAAYGNSLTSYGINNSPEPDNIGRRYNGPCPPGFFYSQDTFPFLGENSPPGTYTYKVAIYALNALGINLSKNGAYPYNQTTMTAEFQNAIIETATLQFTFEFVR